MRFAILAVSLAACAPLLGVSDDAVIGPFDAGVEETVDARVDSPSDALTMPDALAADADPDAYLDASLD